MLGPIGADISTYLDDVARQTCKHLEVELKLQMCANPMDNHHDKISSQNLRTGLKIKINALHLLDH